MLQKIISIANSKGFSVETESSPYGFYTLEKYEIAFLCNNCGEEIILNLLDPNFNSKVENLVCKSDDCNLEEDHIDWTNNGKIAWCCDEMKIISSIKMTGFNSLKFDTGKQLKLPEEGEKDVFVAPDPTDDSYAYAFVVYPSENDVWLSKYLLFRYEISTWGQDTMNVSVCARWPHYYNTLYDTIKQNISLNNQRSTHLTIAACDCYIKTHHAARKNNQALWGMATLYKAINKIATTLDKYVDVDEANDISDASLRKFISLHTCPICGDPYTSTETNCERCNFPELNRQFISKDDAIYWEMHVLEPYKVTYEKKNSQPKEELQQEVIASSDDYFYLKSSGYCSSSLERRYVLEHFYNSPEVNRVVIPDNVEKIGNSVFADAKNLKHIDLPSGLKEIGFTAFSNCFKLQYIVLPETIEKIGRGAFQQSGLRAIFSEATSKPSKWLAGWNLGCKAKVYWKNEWHYDESGNPVLNEH